MNDLRKLARRINDTYEDIRAEVIVSDLLESGVHIDDIIIRFIGQLHRARSRDIAHVQIATNNQPRTQLELTLNRDSIYDTLPEGLFHQPAGNSSTISVSSMVDEYRQQKQEESEARQFFAPFENELFLQKTFTESEEFDQLFYLQQSRFNRPVLRTLGINPELPEQFTSKLLRLIPYNTHIAGNIRRTEQIFTLLLGDPIRIDSGSFIEPETSEYQSKLGDSILGSNLVTGNKIVLDHNLFTLTIGPLPKGKLMLYKGTKWKARALKTLINFFIPVEWDLNQQILIERDDTTSFILNDLQSDARLGYTTSLYA